MWIETITDERSSRLGTIQVYFMGRFITILDKQLNRSTIVNLISALCLQVFTPRFRNKVPRWWNV